VGYVSPDFTSKHPLAFLMQDVFQYHNTDQFQIFLYSLSKADICPEVNAIRAASHQFVEFSAGSDPKDISQKLIETDELDILIDLCGYAGTTKVAELMAAISGRIPIVSYMGFPGSTGAPYMDYMVCDPVVVPPALRPYYTERLIYMPHCYFVNSHKTCGAPTRSMWSHDERERQRAHYGLPSKAFVFCCHSRPDKIDPFTFRTWINALLRVRQILGQDSDTSMMTDNTAVLWLLRSGTEMEANMRRMAQDMGLDDENALVFCDVCPRDQHLQRLACADLFLDTPAYNAHTLGCDTLYVGVPMISLLRPTSLLDPTTTTTIEEDLTGKDGDHWEEEAVKTDKMASRVGASLLYAAGLEELICPNMGAYEDMMVKCSTNSIWYHDIVHHFQELITSCPLFDTERWVHNLEIGLYTVFLDHTDDIGCNKTTERSDIQILDNE
jgi:protein O-GlcNAc transferase